MSTEGQEMTQIVENSPLLCSYFIILENSVVFVCQQSDLAEANTGMQDRLTIISFILVLSLCLSHRMFAEPRRLITASHYPH